MSNFEYTFLVYAEFFVCITLFGLVINTILLKFSKTFGIREKDNTMVRWTTVAKPTLGGITFFMSFLVLSKNDSSEFLIKLIKIRLK